MPWCGSRGQRRDSELGSREIRLNKEGSETVTKCNRLKLPAEDGKMRLTDVASPEVLLRLIQSVPSPKAETMKATGMQENKVAGKKGGGIARKARLDLEDKTGKSVVTGKSFLPPGNKKLEKGKRS